MLGTMAVFEQHADLDELPALAFIDDRDEVAALRDALIRSLIASASSARRASVRVQR